MKFIENSQPSENEPVVNPNEDAPLNEEAPLNEDAYLVQNQNEEIEKPLSLDEQIAQKTTKTDELVQSINDLNEEEENGLIVRESPLEIKKRMAEIHSLVIKKQQELEKTVEEMNDLINQKKQELEAQLRRSKMALLPLKEMVAKMEEGIWSVNLYLGRDEEIIPLRAGNPAPANTPISIRQLMLYMDEETVLFPDSGGLDFNDLEVFDEWILKNPAHLQQVLPEEKGILAFVPSRQRRNYSRNPIIQQKIEEQNKKTFWLIRNGERLYRMTTDFKAEVNIIPKYDEFTRIFQEKDYNGRPTGRTLEPGTKEWLKAEKEADGTKRHYMRVALILQGLIDRTSVFAPLPAHKINLLQAEAYEKGYVHLIMDGEKSLHDGHKPYFKWLSDLNKQLTVGMRIIGDFDRKPYDDERTREVPRFARGVNNKTLYRLVESIPGGFKFLFERTDEIWDIYNGIRKPTKKASYRIYTDSDFPDTFIIPFDLVTKEELRYYMAARTERHNYLDLIPLMQATLRAKEQEEEEEKDFRNLLSSELIKRTKTIVLQEEDARKWTDDLVHWWKLSNKYHRPLRGDEEHEKKALRMILKEYTRRQKYNETLQEDELHNADEKVKEIFFQTNNQIFFIAQKMNGEYIAYSPSSKEKEYFFVQDYRLKTLKSKVQLNKEWIRPKSPISFARIVYTSPVMDKYVGNLRVVNVFTDPEIEKAFEEIHTYCSKNLGEPLWIHTEHNYSYNDSRFQVKVYFGEYEEENKDCVHHGLDNSSYFKHKLVIPTTTFFITRKKNTVVVTPAHNRYEETVMSKDFFTKERENFYKYTNSKQRREFYNQELIEKQTVSVQEYFNHVERFEQLKKEAEKIVKAIEVAYIKREEQKAYERFLEDYGDATLWNTSKIKNKIQFNFPKRKELEKLILVALVHDVPIINHTISEILRDVVLIDCSKKSAHEYQENAFDDFGDLICIE